MKKIKLFFLLFCICSISFQLNAESNKLKRNQVVIVGKINFNCNIDYEKLANFLDLSDEEIANGDFYTLPMTSDEISSIMNRKSDVIPYNKEYEKIKSGNYFMKVIKRDDKISFSTQTSRFCITNFLVYGLNNYNVLIPFPYYINIPEDEKALYIGSIYVYINKDYEIESINIVDEFDYAKEYFAENFSTEYELSRAQLIPLEK